MTPERMNITIAESLGWEWKPETLKPTGHCWHRPDGHWAERTLFYEVRRKEDHCDQLPDCYSDLNACAEFEATLTEERFGEYRHQLIDMLGTRWGTATARQRCEAYLHTIGEWEDQS